MSNILSQVDMIRETFHYQNRFADSIMVFKIDFPVTEDPGFPYLMKDLALLVQTGFKIVIVPGARESIDVVLQQHKIISAYSSPGDEQEPVRITETQVLPFVEMAAFNAATQFMIFLARSRVDAVIGNFVRARGLGVVDGVDMGHTGTVDKIYADSINRVLNLGMVPILPCIGWSFAGKPYNVSSDEIVIAVSAALNTAKLFIVSIHDGLRRGIFPLPEYIETRDDGSLIQLTPQEAEAILTAYTAQNTGALPQTLRELRLALKASRAGLDRVHIIDGREEGAVLKELFSNLGTGTMIYADEYESIRSFRSSDLPDILRLMEPLMQKGILIRRTAEDIQEKGGDYVVFEIDGSIRACGALHEWGENQGEIAAIATDPLYARMNLGRRIVGCLIEEARKNNMNRVFVLTTHTQDWFESLGFREVPVNSLPERKRQVYDTARNSKVFALEFTK